MNLRYKNPRKIILHFKNPLAPTINIIYKHNMFAYFVDIFTLYYNV